MAYQRRRYNAGGGGGGSWLTRLLGSGNTAIANEPITRPGDVPYTYQGDPSTQVGRFITDRGNITPNAYRDVRGFFARASGAPNTAEQLNLELAQAGLLSNQALQAELARRTVIDPMDIERQFGITAATEGLSTEQQRNLSGGRTKAKFAQLAAEEETSRKTGAEAITKRMIAERTRPTDVQTGIAQSVTGRNIAQRRSRLSGTRNFSTLGDAADLASLLSEVLKAQRLGDINLPPNSMSIIQPMNQLFPQGAPTLSLVPPGGIGYGSSIIERPIVQNIGGKPYQTTETYKDIKRGEFKSDIPTSLDEITRLKSLGVTPMPSYPQPDTSIGFPVQPSPMLQQTAPNNMGLDPELLRQLQLILRGGF